MTKPNDLLFVRWDHASRRGSRATLSLLRRMFPQYRLYQVVQGFHSPDYPAKFRGQRGNVTLLWQ